MRDPKQSDRLSRAFDASVRQQQAETRALVEVLAGSRQPEQAGQHGRRTLAQMVRDSGFSDAGELEPVLMIDGRAYR